MINTDDLRDALRKFAFVRSEVVVDYTFLQLEGMPYEPLTMFMMNDSIALRLRVSAKITTPFSVRVRYADLQQRLAKGRGQDLDIVITDTHLELVGKRIHHKIPLVANVRSFTTATTDTPMTKTAFRFTPLLGLEYIASNNGHILGFNADRTLVRFFTADNYANNFVITGVQGRVLTSVFPSAEYAIIEGQLHVRTADNYGIFALVKMDIPNMDTLLGIPPTVSIDLTKADAEEIQTLGFSDTCTFIVDGDNLRILAQSFDAGEGEWVKTLPTIHPLTLVRVPTRTIRELVGDLTVNILSLPGTMALSLVTSDTITVTSGIVRA